VAGDVSGSTGQTKDVVAGGIALATLILTKDVTALHPLFGVPLFLYLIRDFTRPSSLSDRLIMSMAMSFVILLFACYPVDFVLDELKVAQHWDVVLAILWFFILPCVWAARAELELRRSRGAA
jgi:hypothetical protein